MELIQSRLLDLMASKRMSYQDLANITHIHKATLQRYFTGATKKVPIERIWPIAFALDTTPGYLMGDTNDPSPSFKRSSSCAIIEGSPTTANAPTFDIIQDTFIKAQERAKEHPMLTTIVDQMLVFDDRQLRATSAFTQTLMKEDVF